MKSQTPCIFTVDVEDWFHIIDCPGSPASSEWERLEHRVEPNTDKILAMMSEQEVKGTFFILGWIAERYPALVKRIAEQGHEVASHGWSHLPLHSLDRKTFKNEAYKCKALLEDLSGQSVLGFRAPGFSLDNSTLWILDVLIETGYRYDASVLIGMHSHGGTSSMPKTRDIALLPVPTFGIGCFRLPYSGGGYLRIMPFALLSMIANWQSSRGKPVVFYTHPREIDPDQPRLRVPLWRRFKHYVGLSGNTRKLRRILSSWHFIRVMDFLYPGS